MRPYVYFSCAAHAFLVTAMLILGTLLSKPRMSYYGIDLMSSMPAGGPDAGPAVSPIPTPATAIKAPKVSVPKVVAPPAPRPQEEELPDQDTIRLLAKLKKKRLSHTAKEAYEPSHEIGNAPPQESGGSSSAGNAGKGGMGGTG